ncbi:hypothetical protein ABH920_005790 [Catenulispora sp. EB89]|uniref:eCIS core domain-containing protein n=1 Tax=Catenulispora sp. EB89 TaxID=3156257 RepID=UPI003512EEDF
MHANGEKADDRRTLVQKSSARPSQQSSQHPGTAAQLLKLQSTVGNSTVLQLLREAGDPWQAEKHQHGAGCGHHEAEQAVQRSSVPEVLKRSGRPLDSSTRTEVQTKMGGADFSDVRLHDDAAAKASAAEIGAHAYTSGNHIVLGEGGQNTHTLIHELTHVLQQRQGPVAGTVGASGLKMSDPSDRFERQAEANARQVMSGGPSLLGPSRAAAGGEQAGGQQAGTQQSSAQQSGVQQSTAAHADGIQRARYEPTEEVTAHRGFCVILSASLNGVHLGHYTSETSTWSPRDHAEDQLCDEIEKAIYFASSGHLATATSEAGGDVLSALTRRMNEGKNSHTLRIRLSASPCSTRRGTTTKHEGEDGCAERLIYLARMKFGNDRKQRIKIKIKADHLYRPNHMRGSEARAASRAAISDMQAAGIEIEAG